MERDVRTRMIDETVTYREFCVRQELAGAFSCGWAALPDPTGVAGPSRSIPNGCDDLVWHPTGGGLFVRGPSSVPAVSGPTDELIVGLRFRPSGAWAMCHAPIVALLDQSVGAEVFAGRRWRRFDPVMREPITASSAVDALQTALVDRELMTSDPVDLVVARAVEALSSNSHVRDVADAECYSDRQLRRRFLQVVGLSPKRLQGLVRFQRVLALLPLIGATTMTIGEVAVATGYCDQASLVHQCRELSGLTPSQLVSEFRRTCWPHHDHSIGLALPLGWRPLARVTDWRRASMSTSGE